MSNELRDISKLNASLICDAAEVMHPDQDVRKRIAKGISPRGTPKPVIGRAWTMRLTRADHTSPENRQRFLDAYDAVQAGSVLVIQAVGDLRGAVIGDVLAHRLKVAGVLGIVVDGPIRDVAGMIEHGPGTWSESVTLAGMQTTGVSVETGVEVLIGGVKVVPGDLVAADTDGVMFHPASEIDRLLKQASVFQNAEQLSHERIAAGTGAGASYLPKS
ncbi:RraA family protein [Bosea thiooxidans]